MAGEIEAETVNQTTINIDKLRSLTRDYIDKNQYESALFWADKTVSLSNGEIQDIHRYAQTLFLTGQYHRATHLLKSRELDKKYLCCRYLTAKCHFECKELQEALDVLDQPDAITTNKQEEEISNGLPSNKIQSSLSLLRGKVYDAMDNRNLASECFREALRKDVFCFEAFDSLVSHHMMSAQEERELMDSLLFADQCTEEEVELVKFLYDNKLKKYHKPSEIKVPSSFECLNKNVDMVVGMAERHYYNCDFKETLALTTTVLNQDPYNSICLPLHIAVLVELGKSNALFYLAHKLVDIYPNKAVAWFAVGCYYLLIGKNEPARRYLSKATTLDRVYGPAWLAFGHSFAAENEHDQAMAAYFTASQLMKGCHLPVLYIGLEYGLTINTKLAERFFTQALNIAPEDPFVLHEMGVIAFQNKDYSQAEKHFRAALEKVQSVSKDVMAERWEPLLNNLGQTCRKMKKYEESLEYHRHALILSPQNPSTLSSIGYIHTLLGKNAEAVDYFHKALGLRRDDTFSTTMLAHAIEQLMNEMTPCDGVPDVLPVFTYDGKLDESQVFKDMPQPDLSSSSLAVASPCGGAGGDSLLADSSLADSSTMAIDTDMEDV